MATLEKKQEQVGTLTQVVRDANVVLIADYRGLSVAEMTALRNELRKVDVKLTVAKNTLVKRATAGTELEVLAPFLKGPTSLLVGYGDQVAAAKVVKEFLRKNKKTNQLRAGFLDGTVLDTVKVEEFAAMPSFHELRGKLVMCIAHPAMSLARALDQVGKLKEEASA